MIITTPHTEPAQATQNIPDVESPQKLKPEKNGIGVFAKILAGLTNRGLQKTGAEEGAITASGDIPLAENAEFNDLKAVLNSKGSVRAGKTTREAAPTAENEKIKTKKSQKIDEIEPEQTQLHPQQDKNIFFALSRLTDQGTEQIPWEENGEYVLKADSIHNKRETLKTEVVFATSSQDTTAVGQEKQTTTTTAFAIQELTEKPKNTYEKIKNRVNSTESPVSDRQAAKELPNDTTLQQSQAKKTVVGENGRNRLEEARNRDRRRGQSLALEVRDFRSTGTQNEAANKDSAINLRAVAETRLPSEGTSREITLELRLPNQGQDTTAVSSWEAKAGQAFEDMMARELHQNFNNDIVRHASVMLRDSGEGTIRLALKPESLGNVKIRLEMAENKITGHIIVESEEALRAFEQEISSLEKAFRDSGFDGANLEMSLAADSREAQQQWQGTEASRALPWQFAASRYDIAVERMEIPLTLDVYWQGARAINVLA